MGKESLKELDKILAIAGTDISTVTEAGLVNHFIAIAYDGHVQDAGSHGAFNTLADYRYTAACLTCLLCINKTKIDLTAYKNDTPATGGSIGDITVVEKALVDAVAEKAP